MQLILEVTFVKKLYNNFLRLVGTIQDHILTCRGWYQSSRQCNRPSPSQTPETVPNPLLVVALMIRNLRSKLFHGTRPTTRAAARNRSRIRKRQKRIRSKTTTDGLQTA